MGTKDNLKTRDVRRIIEADGIGYAVQDYINPNSVADEELARLIKTAKSALDAIDSYLEDHEEESE